MPIEDNVEILSNCDLLDFTDLDSGICNDNTDSVYVASESLTSCCASFERISSPGVNDIEFNPVIPPYNNTSSLSPQQVNDIESRKQNRKKRLKNSINYMP